jgi:hypothetical protein
MKLPPFKLIQSAHASTSTQTSLAPPSHHHHPCRLHLRVPQPLPLPHAHTADVPAPQLESKAVGSSSCLGGQKAGTREKIYENTCRGHMHARTHVCAHGQMHTGVCPTPSRQFYPPLRPLASASVLPPCLILEPCHSLYRKLSSRSPSFPLPSSLSTLVGTKHSIFNIRWYRCCKKIRVDRVSARTQYY